MIPQTNKQQSTGEYPPEMAENFITSCIDAATGDGVDPQLAQNICKCYLKEIQAQYTYEEFKEVDRQVAEGQPLPPQFNKIVNDCIAQNVN
ncbi:hypothetical protein [Gloeocapsa sp. PCC 73106]|uniref:hypothetical protein n=1 Tax=Gloeocapsa sp. PCC 73106 TaxID=102232 RepID=UPI00030CE137|nr:hypothetical protein [Gloeocapsa sp. PCC 73106]